MATVAKAKRAHRQVRASLGVFAMSGLLVASLQGCAHYSETFYGDVVVHPSTKFAHEIEIRKHLSIQGNAHIPLDVFDHSQDSAEWIYVDQINGRIEAKDLIFTHYWGCLAYPWINVDLRGYIEFSGSTLIIALEGPWYKDGKTLVDYRPLKASGSYAVSYTTEPHLPAKNEIQNAPCDRSWIQK